MKWRREKAKTTSEIKEEEEEVADDRQTDIDLKPAAHMRRLEVRTENPSVVHMPKQPFSGVSGHWDMDPAVFQPELKPTKRRMNH